MRAFFAKINNRSLKTINLYSDNTGAMDLAKDPKFPLHTKHIDIQYHFICEVIEDEKLELKYVPGEENLTDILMKLLMPKTFKNMSEQLGLWRINY